MKVKVCGMKYADNIHEVAQLLPDFMGFIFYSKSARYVGSNFSMPDISSEIKKVGVFVNENLENILAVIKKYRLDYVQLHGDEPAEICKLLKISGVGIIKAFGVDKSFNFFSLKKYDSFCDYFLFDTKTIGYGGSGKSFDKALLRKYNLSKPFFLSGGMDISDVQNVSETAADLYAIDVNSKFETELGVKNIHKLKLLFDELQRK